MNCACGSGAGYEECCGPYLSGSAVPDTAEKLMRSRYTAYARADVGYIEKTMVPEARKGFDPVEAKQSALDVRWKRLQIVATDKGGPNDSTGMVEFTATYEKDGEGIDHHEVSQFRKNKKGEWLFVDGEAHTHKEGEGHHEPVKSVVREGPKIGRNDPCRCGSGKKSKKCCGV